MANFINQFPYMDSHELNLDWIISQVKILKDEMEEFKAINDIVFIGEWDISISYKRWSIVINNNEAYISIQPVPTGIPIENADYWYFVGPTTVDQHAREDIARLEDELSITNDNLSGLEGRVDNIDSQLPEIRSNAAQAIEGLADEQNARAASDELINARIDNIIQLEPGSTTGDAELQDIRVAGNGITYPTAGDSVRAQYTELKDAVANIHPYGIPASGLSLFKKTKNLFSDFDNKVVSGYYGIDAPIVPGTTPIYIKSAQNFDGWLIRVKPNTTYTVGPVDFAIIFGRSDLTFDKWYSSGNVSSTDPNIVTSGPQSYWMAIALRKTRDKSDWMVVEGSTYPDHYIDGYPHYAFNPAEDRTWGYIISAYQPVIKYQSNSAILSMPEARIMYKNGRIGPISASDITFTAANWLHYDITAGSYGVGAAPAGHEYVMLGCIQLANYNSSWIAGTTIKVSKTIAFMGDSLTAGSGTNTCFHEYLHEFYGFTCLNYAYGGTGYVRNWNTAGGGLVGLGQPGKGVPITSDNFFTPNNVLARLSELDPANTDGIVIFAGTNDWSHGDEVSYSDFLAGVRSVFDYCQTNLTNVPVVVMTPIHRVNDTVPNSTTGKTLQDYAEAIKDICTEYGIICIDTMQLSGSHPDNANNRAVFFNRDDSETNDGVHPNRLIHQRLARNIGETLNGIVKFNLKTMR